MGQVLMALALVALFVVVPLVIFLTRLRSIAGRVGSFECALLRPGGMTWTSGLALFTDDTLRWYRLVSVSPRPAALWARESIELGQAVRRFESGKVLEVPCAIAGQRYKLAMHEASHSALVAWLESAAPTQPTLF
ncbi:DUF2550 family protein [Actinomyces timonensis]|uniref:DUF2550 family protein n=1 Tax=Actinomyces timonensis TaxID=1288391 RepID=A0AAU8N3P9_9ACTO